MSHSIQVTRAWIQDRMRRFGMLQPMPDPPVVWHDTRNYMVIERDHIVDLAGDFLLIRGNDHEGRFGLDDQPKFWVACAGP